MGYGVQLRVTVRYVSYVVLLHGQIGELRNDNFERQEATESASPTSNGESS